MSKDVVERARAYLDANAAESGADVLIDELANVIEIIRAACDHVFETQCAGETVYCHKCMAAKPTSASQ